MQQPVKEPLCLCAQVSVMIGLALTHASCVAEQHRPRAHVVVKCQRMRGAAARIAAVSACWAAVYAAHARGSCKDYSSRCSPASRGCQSLCSSSASPLSLGSPPACPPKAPTLTAAAHLLTTHCRQGAGARSAAVSAAQQGGQMGGPGRGTAGTQG